MRISDWSSDVCSSDLTALRQFDVLVMPTLPYVASELPAKDVDRATFITKALGMIANTAPFDVTGHPSLRSEERRVGKECVSTCRSRWSPDHSQTNNKIE